MKKVSEWLAVYDGHDILTYETARAAFEKETSGILADEWPRITADDMRAALAREGRGGQLDGNTDVVPVLDLSDMYAIKLAGYFSDKTGRGFRHRDNIRALEAAGH